MRNPIVNLIQSIDKRDLKTCNRCGCPDLAWVKFKSGKWALVHTSTSRPFWHGDNQAPQGLWAVKNACHNCAEYTKKQAERAAEFASYQAVIDDKKLRSEWCHPKADNPEQILGDAFVHLYTANIAQISDPKFASPYGRRHFRGSCEATFSKIVVAFLTKFDILYLQLRETQKEIDMTLKTFLKYTAISIGSTILAVEAFVAYYVVPSFSVVK